MAIRIHRVVIDDLDASTDGVGTYRFGLEGIDYEIDLHPSNLQALRDALAPYITAGRRLPKKTRKPAARAAQPTVTGEIRAWWAEHQDTHHLPRWRANGPIPREVYDAHREATIA